METNKLAAAVQEASQRPDVRAAVVKVYESLAAETAVRKPLCVLSGRCCRFDEYGHRLYVTTIELAAFIPEKQPADHNWDGTSCPFQIGKLCSVHSIRPMGCRLFFCDQSSNDWQHEQYEIFHAKLKSLHESLDVPYQYVEWRAALKQLGFK